MSDPPVVAGTLCRLIPLDDIGGRVVKYRVEHGDVGGVLGTVMLALSDKATPWEAWYVDTDDPEHRFAHDHHHMLGRFETVEAAALRLAGERFAGVVAEAVKV